MLLLHIEEGVGAQMKSIHKRGTEKINFEWRERRAGRLGAHKVYPQHTHLQQNPGLRWDWKEDVIRYIDATYPSSVDMIHEVWGNLCGSTRAEIERAAAPIGRRGALSLCFVHRMSSSDQSAGASVVESYRDAEGLLEDGVNRFSKEVISVLQQQVEGE